MSTHSTDQPLFSDRILAKLKNPNASGDSTITLDGDVLRCSETGETFPIIDGIPSLFAPSPGEGQDHRKSS